MANRRGAGRGTGKGYRNLRGFPRDPTIHSQSAKGMKQPQKIPKLELLRDYDYEVTSRGLKTATFAGLAKREHNIYKIQEYNKPKIKKFLQMLGYKIVKEGKEEMGDGFSIDKFTVIDKRDGSIKELVGYDDNTALYERGKGGGLMLWKSVPNTLSWYKAEIMQKRKGDTHGE